MRVATASCNRRRCPEDFPRTLAASVPCGVRFAFTDDRAIFRKCRRARFDSGAVPAANRNSISSGKHKGFCNLLGFCAVPGCCHDDLRYVKNPWPVSIGFAQHRCCEPRYDSRNDSAIHGSFRTSFLRWNGRLRRFDSVRTAARAGGKPAYRLPTQQSAREMELIQNSV